MAKKVATEYKTLYSKQSKNFFKKILDFRNGYNSDPNGILYAYSVVSIEKLVDAKRPNHLVAVFSVSGGQKSIIFENNKNNVLFYKEGNNLYFFDNASIRGSIDNENIGQTLRINDIQNEADEIIIITYTDNHRTSPLQ